MGLRKIIKIFEDGNVAVCGLRGRGKDMLIANVVCRRKLPYVSNVNYGGKWFPLDFELLDCGKNTFRDFLSGNVKYYKFPYPDGTDIYLSDAGVYLPAQYCNEINKLYPYIATFQALSRHVGKCNFHTNSQALLRVYDKIREQQDIYIYCRRCWVIFGFVFQSIRIYDNYESALKRIKPFTVNVPLIGSGATRYNVRLQRATYEANHGYIKNMFLIYKNKSKYNTRFFKDMLENGRKENDEYKKYEIEENFGDRLDTFLDRVESFLNRRRRS